MSEQRPRRTTWRQHPAEEDKSKRTKCETKTIWRRNGEQIHSKTTHIDEMTTTSSWAKPNKDQMNTQTKQGLQNRKTKRRQHKQGITNNKHKTDTETNTHGQSETSETQIDPRQNKEGGNTSKQYHITETWYSKSIYVKKQLLCKLVLWCRNLLSQWQVYGYHACTEETRPGQCSIDT